MPLVKPALVSGLQNVAASPPETHAQAAQAWADAVATYASGIVPASTAVAAAAAALVSPLTAAFQTEDAAPGMEAAFATFASSVAGGMTAGGYTGVPPPISVGFAGYFEEDDASTHAEAADDIATLIDDWMKTGTATLIAPPNTVSNWA